jgi:uncharacterized protein (TIGR03435 family)
VTMTVHTVRGLRCAAMLLFVAAPLAGVSFAQASKTGPTASVPGPGLAAPAPAAAFEVSAVKASKAGSDGSDSDFENGRFTATNCSVKTLIEFEGYGIPESRILGGPKWIGTEKFDIEAKMEGGAVSRLNALPNEERRKQTRAMFQQLLADRFKLAVHWESRELPVYAMVAAKKGRVFKATKEPDGHSGTSSNNEKFSARGLTMGQLADALTREFALELGRPVIDKTGVEGRFDFDMKWTRDSDTGGMKDGLQGVTPTDAGPSIFTAIQEQMGLKLESTKGPVQVLIIDHAEMPAEN